MFRTKIDPKPPARVITTRAQARMLCEELMEQPLVSTDTEWYKFDKDKHRAFDGLAIAATFCYRDPSGLLELIYLHNYAESDGLIFELEPWLTNPKCIKTLHNAPVDWHVFANHGILGKGFLYDTMVLDYLVDENREGRHGLKECARDHLGFERLDFTDIFSKPKLKKDGTPFADGSRVITPLDVYIDEHFEATGEPIPPRLVEYATNDVYDGLLLFEGYKAKLEQIPWGSSKTYWDYFIERESKITDVIMKIERRGMPLDIPFLTYQRDQCGRDIEDIEARFASWAKLPINMGSSKQVSHLLFGKGRYEVKKGKKVLFEIKGNGLPVNDRFLTEKDAPQVNAASLEDLVYRLKFDGIKPGGEVERLVSGIEIIREYKAISTQKGTFLDGLLEKHHGGRIHTRINQIGTTSGRFSSAGPNLQNITTGEKDVYHLRDCFVAPPGYGLIVADYSQLEYRLLAHFTQDPLLLEAFRSDMDLHAVTCLNAFEHVRAAALVEFRRVDVKDKEILKWVKAEFDDERKKSKAVNFGVIYGIGGKGLARQLGITEELGASMVESWYNTYRQVAPWQERLLEKARLQGHVKTLIGRYRHPIMARLNSPKWGIKGEEERTIKNAVIQGSAADVVESAMILVDEDPELEAMGCQTIMQVHDELVSICPLSTIVEAAKRKSELMEHPFEKDLRVPLPVEAKYGPTWATAK